MIILAQKGPERRIAIVSNSYALIFNAVKCDPSSPNASKNRPLCAIELIPKSLLKGQGFEKLVNLEVYGFLGLIEIESKIFICTITGKSKVARPIPGETVNKIYAVDFFCLNDERWDFVEFDSNGYPIPASDEDSISPQSAIKHPCHELKKLLSNGSFYYSSDFDLTSLLQYRRLDAHSLSFDDFQEEFMWNSFLMQEIISFRDKLDDSARQVLDDEGFLTTVIRGFAETFQTYIGALPVWLTIISKQSWKRAGTRFNARGIDDESNVANFVETEFIMYSSDYCYSFTELRGSVPVFWEQDTSLINPKVQITRSIEATQPVFDEHFQRLIDKYGPIHVVNLLSTKFSEMELTRRYRAHIEHSNYLNIGDNIYLTEFDFHRETKDQGFSAASRIRPMIEKSLLENGYFSYDVKEGKPISKQRGVFRVNCLDCLDRTNLVQQFLSRYAFLLFLQDFQLVKSSVVSNMEDYEWFQKHNNLWADHGDAVSQIYTGTNALKSSFSRKGKMSLAGALSDATKSVSRMYINNFMDKGKQQNIDTLLGRLPHQQPVQLFDPINEYVTSKLETLSSKFTKSAKINLLVGSFNVNGLTKNVDITDWLFPIGDKYLPDVVVLGMQEVIELNAGSILNADYSKSTFWQQLVNKHLNQYEEKYLLLRAEQMSSLLILFFVKSSNVQHIKRVEGGSKKTGFGGITGNKGAVAIRFEYGDTSFCFVNCHLAAGISNVEERRSDYESITKGINFTRSKKIPHHDSIFWLGDLNYRVTLPNDETRKRLSAKKAGYIEDLLNFDQLTQEMNSGMSFKGFMEPSIQFCPTYKYDHGTNRYDSSEKARTPSWTDRIIYKGKNIQPMAYGDVALCLSDHRPVYSAYKTDVCFVDEAIKLSLTKQLYLKYKETHPDRSSNTTVALIDVEMEKASTKSNTLENSLNNWNDNNLLELDPIDTVSSSNSSSPLSTTNSQPMKPIRKASSSPSINQKAPRVPPSSRSTNSSAGLPSPLSGNMEPIKSPLPLKPRVPPPRQNSARQSEIAFDLNSGKSKSPAINKPVPPPAPARRGTLPPGFSDTILVPKTSSTSPMPMTKTSSPQSTSNSPSINSIRASPIPATSGSENASDPQASAKAQTSSKAPTLTPKNNELEKLMMNSWKPLTPN
ncbi:HCL454Wp [Eremothecium sinecaudum]|uniref:phosphoinositide 5-phosphatase n=1 Tax=Eremothecium sinecaudum TaxID=45286 RepID=A0A120K1T0_9SACH|nr:HCL454Wp [Eremothecium sinecaudum]AMD19697.1 HCL454Wp [Eremothecium sinecaudum]